MNYRTLTIVFFMIVVIAMRVFAPLSSIFAEIANFSGLGAVALFGGSYLKNKVNAFLLPLALLAISDIGLLLVAGKENVFYPGWVYTYISFALIVLVGKLLIKKVTVANVLLSTFVAAFIHWIVSDFGVWYGYDFYPHTLAGFLTCLEKAIPFELQFLKGTLIGSALMFGVFEMLKSKYSVLSLTNKNIIHS